MSVVPSDHDVEPYDEDDVASEAEDSDSEFAPPPPKKMMAMGDSAEADPDGAAGGKGFMAVKPWVGAIVPPSFAPSSIDRSLPPASLSLDWVYGYRCGDSRSNAVVNTRGQVVYPVASLVVVYNRVRHTQSYFTGHTDDVRCLAQNPADRDWVASGQNATIVNGRSTAPHVCVWNSADVRQAGVKLPLADGARAVRSVAFSPDGRFVAAVANDDNHSVYVWEWSKQKLLACSKGDRNAILQVKWNHVRPSPDAYELVTVGVKHAFIWSFNASGGQLKPRRIQLGGAFPTQTYYSVTFSEKGHACLGGFDGTILICKVGTGAASKALPAFDPSHSSGSGGAKAPKVFSLDTYPGGIVAGLTDKSVVVFDASMARVKTLRLPHKVCSVHVHSGGKDLLVGTQGAQLFDIKGALDDSVAGGDVAGRFEPLTHGHFDGELWALAPFKDGSRALTCGEDNSINLWDLTERRLVRSERISDKPRGSAPVVKKASTTSLHPQHQCARAVALSPDETHAAVGTNDGVLRVFTLPDLTPRLTVDLNKYGQRQVTNQEGNWIQTIEYSPDGRTLAVGTHGSVIVLLDASSYAVRGVIKSHHSFLTHMDWSVDGGMLRANDGAYELLFHGVDDPAHPRHLTAASALRDTEWATSHCPFTWGAVGVFEEDDGTQVNSVDRSPDGTLLAAADDHGKVLLYRWPCPEKGQASRAAAGHSSHVTSVRFTSDGQRVLSTGGHDLALFQWKVVPKLGGGQAGEQASSCSSSSSAAVAGGGADFTL